MPLLLPLLVVAASFPLIYLRHHDPAPLAVDERPGTSRGLWFEKDRPGVWVASPRQASAPDGATLNNLQTLGYVSGYKPAATRSGVTTYLNDRAYDGLNLIVSAHKAEAVLADMDGTVLHTWQYEYDRIPNHANGGVRKPWSSYDRQWKNHWRSVVLLDNHDLIAIYDYLGMIKIDKNSNLIWFYPGCAHHDMCIADDHLIYVLTAEEKPAPNAGGSVVEDFIYVLDWNGKEKAKVSVFDCFRNSPRFKSLLSKALGQYEPLHTNGIEVFDRSYSGDCFGARVERGDVLLSMRNNNLLGIVDIGEKRFKTVFEGQWRQQHEPQIQKNGNILLFDNMGYGGFSRILELDPRKRSVVWSYEGTPPESFQTRYCGYMQPLGNGNILITESCSGRAFEVERRSKEIVWEFFNPHRAGEDNELIALLTEVKRIPRALARGL